MSKTMDDATQTLIDLLRSTPHATGAYLDLSTDPPQIVLLLDHLTERLPQQPPAKVHGHLVRLQYQPAFKPLIAYIPAITPQSQFTACQNEPIKLGCQIQPQGAAWIGTAGAPARRTRQNQKHEWGILSNWHVMSLKTSHPGTPQHQPDVTRPACAHLTAWVKPSPNQVNDVDCAFADAWIPPFHTIDRQILEIGPIDPNIKPPTVGAPVTKVGRTTGVTQALIKATNAVVRVSYGDYTCDFAHQILIESAAPPFSAPGDSGSLVILSTCRCPVGLLFAGGGNTTVANEITRAAQALAIDFTL